jgi:hypothetical protein
LANVLFIIQAIDPTILLINRNKQRNRVAGIASYGLKLLNKPGGVRGGWTVLDQKKKFRHNQNWHRKLWPTLEILGSEDNRSEAIVCDEGPDLRRDYFSFPAHHEELAHGPEIVSIRRQDAEKHSPAHIVPYRVQIIVKIRHFKVYALLCPLSSSRKLSCLSLAITGIAKRKKSVQVPSQRISRRDME